MGEEREEKHRPLSARCFGVEIDRQREAQLIWVFDGRPNATAAGTKEQTNLRRDRVSKVCADSATPFLLVRVYGEFGHKIHPVTYSFPLKPPTRSFIRPTRKTSAKERLVLPGI